MKVSMKNINDRIGKIEGKTGMIRNPVKLYYADGRIVETRETVAVISEEIRAYFDWLGYVDNEINDPPNLLKIENLKTGEVWNLEESAREPDLPDADKLFDELLADGRR